MATMLQKKIHQQVGLLLSAYLLTLAMITVTVYCFMQLHYSTAAHQLVLDNMVPWQKNIVQSHQTEKFAYMISLFLLPLLAFSAIRITLYIGNRLSNQQIQNITLLTASLYLPLIYVTFYNADILSMLAIKITQQPLLLYLISSISLYLLYTRLHKIKSDLPASRLTQTMLINLPILIAIILPILCFKIYNQYSVSNNNDWNNNFELPFYGSTQLIHGKSLLVDLPSIYGLFPEFLNPIFHVIGLSVFTFTFVMAILEITLLIALYVTLTKFIRSKMLLILCMLTLCLAISSSWYPINNVTDDVANIYFQYCPIRVLFPAIAVLLFSRLITQKYTHKFSILFFATIASIAALWNFDSGVPIIMTLMIYLGSFVIFPSHKISRALALQFIAITLFTIICTVTAFFVYLFIKSGFGTIHFTWITKFQRLFFLHDYGAQLIPTGLHPWIFVAATYTLGMTTGFFFWLQGKRSAIWDMIFCLSILGFGLLPYYIGRANTLNLIHISWPAIMIAYLIADQTMRLIQLRLLPALYAAFWLPLLFFGLVMSAETLYGIPALLTIGQHNWNLIRDKNPTSISRNTQFIESLAYDKKNIIILGPLRAIYYSNTDSVSPLNLLSRFEILLASDYQDFLHTLMNSSENQLFIQLDAKNRMPDYLTPLLSDFTLSQISRDNMGYFVRKTERRS